MVLVALFKSVTKAICSCHTFKKSDESDSLLSHFLKERFAFVALYKKSNSLFFNERAICFFLSKNEQFARKTKERIPNPGILGVIVPGPLVY